MRIVDVTPKHITSRTLSAIGRRSENVRQIASTLHTRYASEPHRTLTAESAWPAMMKNRTVYPTKFHILESSDMGSSVMLFVPVAIVSLSVVVCCLLIVPQVRQGDKGFRRRKKEK